MELRATVRVPELRNGLDTGMGIGCNHVVTALLHDDEIEIDLPLVRALVNHSFPAWAPLPLRPLAAHGSSNALFRLGEARLVRLPRQAGGSATISKEAQWLPKIGPRLPVPVPDVLAVGAPALGYPERWSVVRWLDGVVPAVIDAEAVAGPISNCLARDLANAIQSLREIDVPKSALLDPALRWYRGEPLASHDAQTRAAIEACRAIPHLDLDLGACLRVWDDAVALPSATRAVQPRWYHGDMFAENLLVRDGRLAAILDFGGLGVGDPTVDLICAWEVLDAPAREVFRMALHGDAESWLRGRAWALSLALGTFPYYWWTMPGRCASRLAMARSVLTDAGSR